MIMNKAKFNISGSYEDEGWKSLVDVAENSNDNKWKSNFGDVRSDMGFLNTKDAYRILDTELGVYYNKVFANTADSRGGFLQVSCFVPIGYRPVDICQLHTAINNVYKHIVTDNELIKGICKKEHEAIASITATINNELKSIKLEEDYKLCGRKPFTTTSSKTVYRKSAADVEDYESVIKFFEYPHQEVNIDYYSVYLIAEDAIPDPKAIAITTPFQKVYAIVNQQDVYHIVEGSSFDVPLKSYPEMEPKTYKVTADGNNTKVYKFNGTHVEFDEKNVDFTRSVSVVISYPHDLDKNEKYDEPEFEVDGIKSTEIEKNVDNGKIVLKFTAGINVKTISVKSNYFGLIDAKIDPTKTDKEEFTMNLTKRNVDFQFIHDDKSINLGEIIKINLSNKSINLRYDKKSKLYTYDQSLNNNETYSVEFAMEVDYEIQNKNITIESSIVQIPIKPKLQTFYIKLENKDNTVYLKGEAKYDPRMKKFMGLPTKQTDSPNGGKYKLIVVNPIYKLLTLIFGSISLLLLTITIYLGFCQYMDKQTITDDTSKSKEVVDTNAPIEQKEPTDTILNNETNQTSTDTIKKTK